MNHRRFHWLEKLQVQMATAGALAVVYFLLWPVLKPVDPQGPVAFVAWGQYGELAVFAAIVLGVSAVTALLTVTARAEGPLLAALIGTGGISLHSPQVRGLLWLRQDNLGGLFHQFIGETVILTLVVLAAAVVAVVIRALISSIKPDLVGRSVMDRLSEEERRKYKAKDLGVNEHYFGVLGDMLVRLARKGTEQVGTEKIVARPVRRVLCAGLALGIVVVLLMLLMQSTDRGQIIFAMFASFLLAVLIAHQVVPTPLGVLVLLLPVVVAVMFYTLASASAISGQPNAWMKVNFYACALPVDWVTVGSGGALLGYWFSQRIHEARIIESMEEELEDE